MQKIILKLENTTKNSTEILNIENRTKNSSEI